MVGAISTPTDLIGCIAYGCTTNGFDLSSIIAGTARNCYAEGNGTGFNFANSSAITLHNYAYNNTTNLSGTSVDIGSNYAGTVSGLTNPSTGDFNPLSNFAFLNTEYAIDSTNSEYYNTGIQPLHGGGGGGRQPRAIIYGRG